MEPCDALSLRVMQRTCKWRADSFSKLVTTINQFQGGRVPCLMLQHIDQLYLQYHTTAI